MTKAAIFEGSVDLNLFDIIEADLEYPWRHHTISKIVHS
jgi:hypothetical protein